MACPLSLVNDAAYRPCCISSSTGGSYSAMIFEPSPKYLMLTPLLLTVVAAVMLREPVSGLAKRLFNRPRLLSWPIFFRPVGLPCRSQFS